MALLVTKLGNGQSQAIENDTFSRMCKEDFYDWEEVRFDIPLAFNQTFSYVAVAPAGTSPSALSWACIRASWFNGRKVRMQFREGISWDDRSSGWN